MPLIVCTIFCIFWNSSVLFAQDDLPCQTAMPFCADASQELTFPNTTGVESLGQIGCLNTSPNPAWFYIRIDQPGVLEFDIVQWVEINDNNTFERGERQLDVDFVAWGPFQTFFVNCDDLATGCDNDGDGEDLSAAQCRNNIDDEEYYIDNMDNTNIMDCSWSRNTVEENPVKTETFTIPTGQSGEYYIILLTNFANEAGIIQLQQTNLGEPDAGTTDCSILEEGLGDDIGICGNGPVIIQGRFNNAVSYQWFEFSTTSNAFLPVPVTTPFYDNARPGTYRLEGRDINGDPVGSDDIVVSNVTNSLTAVGYTIAEESFAGRYTITAIPEITVGDPEDFEYSIDGLEFQDSPVFTDVFPGDHVITGRHIAGCSEVDSEVIMILGYPQYFTPNGDGFHDTWSLINIEDQPLALIYIFDRNGKLLKQLQPGSIGWDGTYNGALMPSSEYWFRVEFNEPRDANMRRRTFAGSFSLIR